MTDREIRRRDLLRGRIAPPREVRPDSPGPVHDAVARPTGPRPLPAVIAWLDRDPCAPPPPRATPPPPVRPPGAVDEPTFLARCTRCGQCARACPHDAIQSAPERFGRAAGTPWIDAFRTPCHMCEDFPCVEACEPRALVLEQAGPIGTAQVRALDCLNRLGSPCSTCIEHCPVPDALVLRQGIPVVEPALCTGCGLCAHACPAPDKAILLVPAERRFAPAS